MSEKICRYNKDEFCVNDQCPMCADYCPVAQNPGVCKYEELVEDETSLTPKECLRKAFVDQGYRIDDIGDFDTDEIIKKFLKFMTECGHVQKLSIRYNIKSEDDYRAGMTLPRDYVKNSEHWHVADDAKHDVSAYVTTNGKFVIRFYPSDKEAVIENNKQPSFIEEFVVGKQIHVGTMGASKDWEYVGEQNGRDVYITKNKLLMVSFNKYDDSVWGNHYVESWTR